MDEKFGVAIGTSTHPEGTVRGLVDCHRTINTRRCVESSGVGSEKVTVALMAELARIDWDRTRRELTMPRR
jgi:hypothetical protein